MRKLGASTLKSIGHIVRTQRVSDNDAAYDEPEALLAKKLPYTALRDAILMHPTIAEGFTVLFVNEPVPPEKAH